MLRVRKLIKEYTAERVNAACKLAVENEFPKLSHVKKLLVNGREGSTASQVIQLNKFLPRENLRGADYFKRDLGSKGEK